MKKIAVILSGCGVFDGSEIYETVITLLELNRLGVEVQAMAPNVEQMHVINHLSQEVEATSSRNVLVESARIVRGDIIDIAEANANEYDACIFPGGFGAAKNLCDFAVKGETCSINQHVLSFSQDMAKQCKPFGFICIAPAMIPLIFGEGVVLTIGNDTQTAQAINAMGGHHVECPVDEFIIDKKRKIVTTPAYMLAGKITEAEAGIKKLVNTIVELS